MLIIFMVIPFFIPSDYIQLYGEFARVGAGVFLVLQLISVIEFITWWNNYWMPDERKKQSCSLGLFMSTICYIASICGILVMYVLYASKTSCSLNIFLIAGLELVRELFIEQIIIKSDSQLIVNQMQGTYTAREP
ncbi:uncharacterized protein LOC142168850 [Nicotiana tabacum]|uniref:Uncharacterized protein LOC142168850 n=1 Tax=Nicotiana tabacum TaxID=4097 RepID=A0AC58SMC9_TOBAC